jgi:hypothetical protein
LWMHRTARKNAPCATPQPTTINHRKIATTTATTHDTLNIDDEVS